MRIDPYDNRLLLSEEASDALWDGQLSLDDILPYENRVATDPSDKYVAVEGVKLPDGTCIIGMDRSDAAVDDEDMASAIITPDGAKALIQMLVDMLGDEILPD